MPALDAEDDKIFALIGGDLRSDVERSVHYELSRRIGEGGMAVAFAGSRVSPEGRSPVVVKILRPWFVRQYGDTASLIVRKEAVALGRLNERVPVCPFVVRLIDVGNVSAPAARLELPWVAVEYVHGGAEGTTLTERVVHCVRHTGAAFDRVRAIRAIECLAEGLDAVHEVGVIHRDMKPDNVLCCGFGDEEMFKVADFGVARPKGLSATFGGIPLGTPGYAAPELMLLDQGSVGPGTDVFGLAAIFYFLLTGEQLFQVTSPGEALAMMREPSRRSLLQGARLHPELRADMSACRQIDRALAIATSGSPEPRPNTALVLAQMIVPALLSNSTRSPRAQRSLVDSVRLDSARADPLSGWRWVTRQNPSSDMVVHSVGWDADGHCLGASSHGLRFWNGTVWVPVPEQHGVSSDDVRFVHRVGPGRWLVGSADGTLAVYTSSGPQKVMQLQERDRNPLFFSGNLDDIGVLVTRAPGAEVHLHAMVGRRWLRPLPLGASSSVSSLARVADTLWLVAGSGASLGGQVALYSPLDWNVRGLPTPPARAFMTCAGHPDRRVGLAGGANGWVVHYEDKGCHFEQVPGAPDLSAVAVDASGCCWSAAAGQIWHRSAVVGSNSAWSCAWQDNRWGAPVVSLFADLGFVIGVTADGGIIEGRSTVT